MTFKFNKSLRSTFDLEEALKPNVNLVTAQGAPAVILMVADNVHLCSTVVFKWAQLDVTGKVIAWHITTATPDGLAQLGAGHKLFIYDGDIDVEPSEMGIW